MAVSRSSPFLPATRLDLGRMIFSSGFIHGDPHPGNIFVMKKGRVALIDCGQVAQIYREQRLLVAEVRDVSLS